MGDKVRLSRKLTQVAKEGEEWVSTFETPNGIEVNHFLWTFVSFFFLLIWSLCFSCSLLLQVHSILIDSSSLCSSAIQHRLISSISATPLELCPSSLSLIINPNSHYNIVHLSVLQVVRSKSIIMTAPGYVAAKLVGGDMGILPEASALGDGKIACWGVTSSIPWALLLALC